MSRQSNSSSDSRATGNRQAFTLVEVLVVMAIVAVLVSLLLPALGRSRELMKLTICQTNLRTLGLGMLRYTQENGEHYPYSAPNAMPEDWVYWETGRNLAIGGIAPYISTRFNDQIYICPDDDVTTHQRWPTSQYPFSYSMNINIGGYYPWGDAPNGHTPPYYPGVPNSPSLPNLGVGQIKHPSNCMLLIEESEQTLDDGCWAWQGSLGSGMNVMSARHDQQNRELINDPNNTSAGRGNALYCDGHVSFVTRADSFNPLYFDPTK